MILNFVQVMNLFSEDSYDSLNIWNFNGLFTFFFQRESDVEKLQQGQIRAEKRVKALKERMKKMTPGQAPGLGGPDPDEIFEDEEEGNE